MGKIVVTEFVSLDGVAEDPGGAENFKHGGWSFKFDRGPEGDKFKMDELVEAEVQLLGRRTYEGFAAAWPQMDQDDFGKKMNSMPKYVVSKTLGSADWTNSTILSGDMAQEVAQLKQDTAGSILVAGSISLAQGLLAAGLVDQLNLMVFPVILGSGKRLYPDNADDMARFTLASSQQVSDEGVLTLVYQAA
jgi:dihydrofolate reductase